MGYQRAVREQERREKVVHVGQLSSHLYPHPYPHFHFHPQLDPYLLTICVRAIEDVHASLHTHFFPLTKAQFFAGFVAFFPYAWAIA